MHRENFLLACFTTLPGLCNLSYSSLLNLLHLDDFSPASSRRADFEAFSSWILATASPCPETVAIAAARLVGGLAFLLRLLRARRNQVKLSLALVHAGLALSAAAPSGLSSLRASESWPRRASVLPLSVFSTNRLSPVRVPAQRGPQRWPPRVGGPPH